jgi:hypothetical protein
MNTWIRKVGMGAVALTLAGVLGGCNNGSGSGLIRLFFGINGDGDCTSVIVDVDLNDADAIIAHDEFGDVQCALNAILDDEGCDVSFNELENGNLRVVISGCTIPAITNLFSCLFEEVDISDLQDNSAAQCTCDEQGCDGTPPICITIDPEDDPRTCEDCDNGIDDDDNGLTDCDDPNCENSPQCEPTTTTSVTSTSTSFESTTTTSSTSTTVSITTSTTNETFNCTVIFRLDDDVTLGSLQFTTDYSNAPGGFLGSAGQVQCDDLLEGATKAFNDKDGEEELVTGLITTEGIDGPTNVSQCTFAATQTPVAGDFTITVDEASDIDLNAIDPLPGVSIQSIDCEVGPTTTQGPVTTTTLGGTTTTTAGDGLQNYNITFNVTAAGTALGALQFLVDYETATGDIQGSAGTAACVKLVDGASFAINDKDVDREITLGIINTDGFATALPDDVARCTFNGNASDPPVPGDFVITLQDVTDTNGDPTTATVVVAVTAAP